jgi:hypothetical protein
VFSCFEHGVMPSSCVHVECYLRMQMSIAEAFELRWIFASWLYIYNVICKQVLNFHSSMSTVNWSSVGASH